jgi:hypothetical protein
MAWFWQWTVAYRKPGELNVQVTCEKTIFMQKAIYFVSKLIAARGIIELTDRCINFQVSPLDSSFGMKNLSIDLCSVTDVSLVERELRPKIVLAADGRNYEFIFANCKEFEAKLRQLLKDPLTCDLADDDDSSDVRCSCGKRVCALYHFCPWCGEHV